MKKVIPEKTPIIMSQPVIFIYVRLEKSFQMPEFVKVDHQI